MLWLQLHSILWLSKLGKQPPKLSAATCSNPVITGPSVPSKNHNWNHLYICFLFSSPKLLHGQYYICKLWSSKTGFFFNVKKKKKKKKENTNADNLVEITCVWYNEPQKSGVAVKNGFTLSFHPIIASLEEEENIINPRGKWLFSHFVIQTSVYMKGAQCLAYKDIWALLWKCLGTTSAPSLLPSCVWLFVFT